MFTLISCWPDDFVDCVAVEVAVVLEVAEVGKLAS